MFTASAALLRTANNAYSIQWQAPFVVPQTGFIVFFAVGGVTSRSDRFAITTPVQALSAMDIAVVDGEGDVDVLGMQLDLTLSGLPSTQVRTMVGAGFSNSNGFFEAIRFTGVSGAVPTFVTVPGLRRQVHVLVDDREGGQTLENVVRLLDADWPPSKLRDVQETEAILFCTHGAGARSLQLPPAAQYPGRRLTFKNNNTQGTTHLQLVPGDIFAGAPTLNLPYSSKTIISDGVSTWLQVAGV
jgi:hypothetical protein